MRNHTVLGLWTLCVLAFGALQAGEAAFSAPPTAKKQGDKLVVSFGVAKSTDVEVAILNAKGEAVRHLAAGVLGGAKAPPEPLKPGLTQTLEWDGKDDFGKPAVGGPFKARVRAGTRFKFGRMIGEDPYTFGSVDGLACDEDGNLYISSYQGTHNQGARTVRVYDGQGRYLREIAPFPSKLLPDAMKNVARWDAEAKVWRPTNYSCLNPDFYGSPSASLVAASQSNGVFFADQHDVYALNADGSVKGAAFGTKQKPWPVFDATNGEKNHYGHPWHYHEGVACYAASPDGKWLYLTGPVPNKDKRKTEDPRFPLGGVYRMRLDGKDEMKLFVSLPIAFDGSWWKDGFKIYGRTGPIHFVGCDAKNNVYVPDRDKNRVVVFSEDGKQIGEVAVMNPHQIVAHPKSGAFYVLRMVCNGWNTHALAVEKFENFAPGAKPAALYDKFPNKVSPRMAVTVSGGKTVVWIAGLPEGLLALEDQGAALAPVETAFKRRPEGQIDWNRLAVDYARDELYVADGGNLIWRYDGKTGQGGILRNKQNKPLAGVDLSVGYDGLLYIRTGESFSGPLERFTRDLEPAPYKHGTHVISPQIYSRYGIGNCEKGLGCGPNGEVYISFMYDWTLYAVGGFGGDGKALKGKYLEGKFPATKPESLKGYPEDLRTSVLGPITSAGGGIRVDLKGNIYVGLDVKPAGFKPPGFLTGDQVATRWYSSVVKFGPEGGAVLGIKDSESKMPAAPKLELEGKMAVENAQHIYSGLGPVSGPGPGGNSSCCVCRVPRFDVDRYGRLAMPSAFAANVLLFDNAGNTIAEIGSYGNFDAQYVNPHTPEGKAGKPALATPDIPLAWPSGAGFSEHHLYLNDTYNRRVIRVDFEYAAEQAVALP
ncbi:MAG: hypothetical protein HS116_11715 [Planctomycetes bacterium]|nr:hypothetical protein [Planctomycetota bacterium]